MRTLRIGFLLPRRSLHGGNYMYLVMRALAEAGADVDAVYPVDLSLVRVEHDLYVFRKTSGLLYGVDVIESEGKPYVVDMCSIPGFKGVPDAPALLAEYFYRAAELATRGDLVAQATP